MKRVVDPSQELITWVTPYCKSSKEYRMKLGKTPMIDSVELNTFTNQGNEVQRCARINPRIESYV